MVQSTAPESRIPAPTLTFEGVSAADNPFPILPPDTTGDIGPNHYVQWVNISFAIFDRSGTLLFGPTEGNVLWDGFGGICESNNDGDVIVQYDQLADRWFMSQFALDFAPPTSFHQCIAVSTTGDPTGSYNRYDFLYSDTVFNDYGKFGVWPDGYYMAVNQFDGDTFEFLGAGVMAFERDAMLIGDPAQAVQFDLDDFFGGMLPSDLDGFNLPPAGSPNIFAEVDSGLFIPPDDAARLWEFHVDWDDPLSSTFGTGSSEGVGGQPNATLPVAPFIPLLFCGDPDDALLCVPQPDTAQLLDGLGERLMYRASYRVFNDGHHSLVLNHSVDATGEPQAAVRWYELQMAAGTWGIEQQGTFAPDSLHRWMGSAAINGDSAIAIGYSLSSTDTVYPSIAYAGRLASDPAGTLDQGEMTMTAGAGSQTHSAGRWGDYSTMSIDPTDDCSFWFTSEYYSATAMIDWRTRVGTFAFSPCTSTSAPGPPRDVTAEPRHQSGLITWDEPVFDGRSPITGYNITAEPGSIFKSVPAGTTQTVLPGLTNGVDYRVTVMALNGIGNGSPSAPSNQFTPSEDEAWSVTGPGALSEDGVTSTVSVVLTNQPFEVVTVTMQTDSQTMVNPTFFEFDSTNWDITQTAEVSAVDDAIAEGAHSGGVTLTVTTADLMFQDLMRSFTSSIADNDAGVLITESSGSTTVTEGGASDTYTLVLSVAPTSTVFVTATADAQVDVTPDSLEFTTANWDTPQTITIDAVDDADVEGPHSGTVTHTTFSSDQRYDALSVPSVIATVIDNDVVVLVTETAGSTVVTEGGAPDTYTIVLSAPPTDPVTVNATAGPHITVSPESFVFDSSNWDTPQSASVSAINDTTPEGTKSSIITHTASSADPRYDGLSVPSVPVTVNDNDPGLLIVQSGGSTNVTEGGASDTYTMVLSIQPTSDVTVTTSGSQVSTSPMSFVFDSSNWDNPQVATVNAIDDSVAEGTHSGSVGHSLTSGDARYDGLAGPSVPVTITDNDAGVLITESSGSTTVSEGGASDTYTLVLSIAPTSTVFVTATADAQVSVTPDSLEFTTGNWDTPQTITIDAVDDADVEGTHSGTVTHTTFSSDPSYNALSVPGVIATIFDNDAPPPPPPPPPVGYWLVASDGGVFAFGSAGFFGSTGGVRLNRPVVGMAPTAAGQGYWLVASDGGVFTFGDGKFHGSMGGLRLNAPIVGMAPTPSGNGYWLVASDGGIFAFGDAAFFGSTGGISLSQPIVGMAPTDSGDGYWLVASDGGIFAFGDAAFHGSTGGLRLNRPIVGMAATPSGNGYWMVASDGGIFAFGDAGFFGSTGGISLNQPIVGMAASPSGNGYWMVASDGGIFAFGDAAFHGSMGGTSLNQPMVGMAAP